MNSYKMELLRNILQENIELREKFVSIRNYYATLVLECYKDPQYNDNYKIFYDYVNDSTIGGFLGKPKEIVATEEIYFERILKYTVHSHDMLNYYHKTMIRKVMEKNKVPKELFNNIIKYI
uniref:Uncharacterized protein n=1 Tax=viral metagenome TaxID=1070528 RepID=A0A6C0C3S1_9ZZZZ